MLFKSKKIFNKFINIIALLHFPGESEKAFRHYYYKKTKKQFIIASILGISLYTCVDFIDPYIVPDTMHKIRFIRHFLVVPVVIFSILMSYLIKKEKANQILGSLNFIAAACGVALMMAIDKTSISIVYFSGLILSVVYGYSCWSLRFNYAVFCGWTSLIFYAVTAFYIRNTPLPILINNISFCAIANFIGMFIAYILETTLRKEYRHSIEMKKTQKNLHDLSLNDDVVKIPNRRFFNLRLLTEFNDLREKKQPLSLIIADVDYFKNYNDSSGHVAGDECLRKVAEQLQHLASYVDSFVARFGGEEFAIILPNTSLPEARITAEKIRKIFKNQKICHPASPICDIVTLSFGVATIFPSINTSPENLIKAADSALYAAKENGRDRVEICPNTA